MFGSGRTLTDRFEIRTRTGRFDLSKFKFVIGAAALLYSIFTYSAASAVAHGLHGFGFDAVADSPDAEVLDFKYGNSGSPGTHASGLSPVQGGTSTYLTGKPGETLFVKWRLKIDPTQVYEKTVDLRGLLPANMSEHTIYFVVQNTELYVFLVTPIKRLPDEEIIGPRKFRENRVHQIFP